MSEHRPLPDDGPQSPAESYSRTPTREERTPQIRAETALDILGDEYARQILGLLVAEPRTGRELSEETGMSRPTVYRRLETLRENGLVRSEMTYDPDGHHRKEFDATATDFEFDSENEKRVSLAQPDPSLE